VRGKSSGLVLAKRKCQTVKQVVSSVPDVTVSACVKSWLEGISISISNHAVYAISADK
jgi:hypothetical protein